jgi:hypothetical protein
MHQFYLGFHVDKCHLKQTNKKELEHFTKDSLFSKNIKEYRCPIVVFPLANFLHGKLTISSFPPRKNDYIIEHSHFSPQFSTGEKWLYSRISSRKNGYIVNFLPRLNITLTST